MSSDNVQVLVHSGGILRGSVRVRLSNEVVYKLNSADKEVLQAAAETVAEYLDGKPTE